MSKYFIEFKDENLQGDSIEKFNQHLKSTKDTLISYQYQVVRYEQLNAEKTYILTEWEKS